MSDPRLAEFAHLRADKTKMRDLWLLFSNGNHYDALITEDHPLLTLGGIKDSKGDEEVRKKAREFENKNSEKSHSDQSKDNLIKDLERKLKQVEALYRGSEEQVKDLEEEKDRLKIDVKDLTEYIQKKEYDDIKGNAKEDNRNICKLYWKENTMQNTQEINAEQMFNCDKCSFQSTRQAVLSKHKNTTQRKAHEQTNDVFRCNGCEIQFSERWNLMHHKRDNHEVTEICQHCLKGTCKFMPTKKCWLLHKEKTHDTAQGPSITEEISCYVCKQKFQTRNGMMRHRIRYHIKVVP